MMIKKKVNIEYIFTLTILLLPIINIYKFPTWEIPIGDILLLINAVLFIVDFTFNKRNERITVYRPLLKYIIFITFQFLLFSLIKSNSGYFESSFFTTFHYIFYLIFALFFIKKHFEPELGINLFKSITIISTLYILIQEFALRIFSIYIPGHIPGVELTNMEIMEFNNTASNITDFVVRPRSIFPEPAHYAQYVLVYLAINLGTKKEKAKDYLLPLLLSIGILVSRSSTGIILSIYIWIYHIVTVIKTNNYKIKLSDLLVTFTILPIALLFILNSSFFDEFLNRFITSSGLGRSTLNRFGAYNTIFRYLKTSGFVELFFGHGMVEPLLSFGYMPGFIRLFYYFGIIGMIIMLFFYIQIGRIIKNKRILFFLMIFMNFGGDSIFGSNLLLYLPFVIHSNSLLGGTINED